jgi:CRISPR/Cas system CSM-associated protein Csm3 (group 7 of RAMP superfamily)
MGKGMIVLKGTIELQSPMLIGSGENENSDIDVLVDSERNPFIPATSFVGVLKNYLSPVEDIEKNNFKLFWGYSEGENTMQSILSCSDLQLSNLTEIVVREGVEIDMEKGIAEPKGKFDFEIVERGTQFNLKLEADYDDSNEVFIKMMFETIKYELENTNIRVGAKTKSGLGKIILKNSDLFEYNFSNKDDVLNYFKKAGTNHYSSKGKFDVKSNEFVIDAWFDLKTSLISRSYSTNPEAPDSTHIKSLNDYIMPGIGLKGAISSRAERILNTKFADGRAELVYKSLFGFVDKNKKEAKRSRVCIEETILPKEKLVAELQNRIKIDRFTGGTIKGALFDSMPLFRKDKSVPEKVIKIKISIKDYEKYEAGLMLLVLKDLWTGDLPIGGEKNVGRGVLEGVYAEITNGNILEITEPQTLTNDQKKGIQFYVEALNQYEAK